MKIEKEFNDDHQVKLTVELDPEPFEKAKRRAAKQIAKRTKIPGFRPGKAPYGVILRQVGEGYVVEQALELLIEDQYPKIIEEAEIDPFGPGKLDNVPELDPPTFEFIVPLNPEIKLGDYKSIKIPYKLPKITKKKVDAAIEQAREQNAKREKVERPAEMGDVVFMQVSGVKTDIEDEDDDPTIIQERFSSSVIKDEEDDEFPFPGFSKELIGLSTDDEKTIPYQYPNDYKDESLQGVKADFSVKVTNIQSVVLPEIDNDLAKQAGGFDTLEEWKSDLKNNLEEEAKKNYANEYDDKILEKIVSESEIKYPPQMIEDEKADIIRGLEYQLSQQGLNKDLYLQIRGIDEDGLNEEITPVAETRVKQALVLMEIAKIEDIEIDQEEVKEETGRTIGAIASSMTPNEAKKFAKSAYVPNLITNIAADMTTRTTMEYLRALAKGEPWPPVTDEAETDLSEEEKEEDHSEVETVEEKLETVEIDDTTSAGSEENSEDEPMAVESKEEDSADIQEKTNDSDDVESEES